MAVTRRIHDRTGKKYIYWDISSLLLNYFDFIVSVDNWESGKHRFNVWDITMKPKMGKPRTNDKGRGTPPVSSQQAPSKNTGQKHSGAEKSSHSPSDTSKIISNANKVLYVKHTTSAVNKAGAFYQHAPDSQYTTQLQFNATHDKHNGNGNVTATTYTTTNPAINSGPVPPN